MENPSISLAFFKEGAGFGVVVIEVFAHAYELRSLAPGIHMLSLWLVYKLP